MIRTLVAAAMFACVVFAAAAQNTGDTIKSVIGQQIDAFLSDDFATAFTFASPMIQQMFGTPDRFGMMVRQGYPMVWRPSNVTYLERRSEGSTTVQQVLVEDSSGTLHTLEYRMIEGPDGWRINGVAIVQAQLGV